MRHYLLGMHIVLQDLVVRNYMGLTLSCPDHDVRIFKISMFHIYMGLFGTNSLVSMKCNCTATVANVHGET